MQQKKFKTGDIVRVTIKKTVVTGKKPKTEDISTEPTIGMVTYVHPEGFFYVVEFRDKYAAKYKRMYRRAFRPEELSPTKIKTSEFTATRPAKKKSWVKQEG